MVKKRLFLILTIAVLSAALAVAGVYAYNNNWSTHLSGDLELPVMVDTQAQGQAIFHLSEDGNAISYRLMVANIENVFMAHIHAGDPASNGPIVVWLYPSEPFTTPPVPPDSFRPGRTDGVLAEGEFTADDFTGPLAGQPLSVLVDMMNSGTAYVNVHTSDFQGADNTGAGDMSRGEIRGNIH